MAGATCDERLVRLLLDHGANVANANAHGWTALHQAAYSNLPVMARDAARRRRACRRLRARRRRHPVGHRAVLGQPRRPPSCSPSAGWRRSTSAPPPASAWLDRSRPPPARRAAFYRPHSGFPAWHPGDDPQEALDEAVAWAARNDRVEAIDALAARGAALDRDVYRGTPLAWAAACGRVGAIRHLVARGVDPSARSTFGGPDHGRA